MDDARESFELAERHYLSLTKALDTLIETSDENSELSSHDFAFSQELIKQSTKLSIVQMILDFCENRRAPVSSKEIVLSIQECFGVKNKNTITGTCSRLVRNGLLTKSGKFYSLSEAGSKLSTLNGRGI